MVRLLFLPSGFKQYALSAIDLTFFDFFISDIVSSIFYALEAALISSEFKKFSDFVQNPKKWGEKSASEKF